MMRFSFWYVVLWVLVPGVIIVITALFNFNDMPTMASSAATNSLSIQKATDHPQKKYAPSIMKTRETPSYYSVVKVIDGDTLSIDMNGAVITLRLIGVNTPETVDPRKSVECFGVEASNRAKEILTGQKVRIEEDSSQGVHDKYGRLLAYVFLEDGVHFNKLMISEGYAYEYTYNLPYKYQTEFKIAQQQAKSQKKGLWADGVCETQRIDIPNTTIQNDTSVLTGASHSSHYTCTYNAYDCLNFSTHKEAQFVYELCGGVPNDIHLLDQDKDGLACENLP